MAQRRHATVILFGDSYQTFTPMQAFQQSVHAVINSSELFLIKQLIEKQRAIVGQIVPNREGQGSGFKLQDSIPRI